MKHNRVVTVLVVLAVVSLVGFALAAQPGYGGHQGPHNQGPGMMRGMGPGGAQGWGFGQGRAGLASCRMVVGILSRAHLSESELKQVKLLSQTYQKALQKLRKALANAETREERLNLLKKFEKETRPIVEKTGKLLAKNAVEGHEAQLVRSLEGVLDRTRGINDEQWQRARLLIARRLLQGHGRGLLERPGMGRGQGQGFGPGNRPGAGRGRGHNPAGAAFDEGAISADLLLIADGMPQGARPRAGQGQRYGRGQGQGQGRGWTPGQGTGRGLIRPSVDQKELKKVLAILDRAHNLSDSDYRQQREKLAKGLAKIVVAHKAKQGALIVLRCPQTPQIIDRMLQHGTPVPLAS